ncbi:MAG: hypothetical protein FJX59_14800 [Alphaproteobacteria bacterium]|nr:hypothetical protein [Alphaproteobacteria bacterium]
MSVEIWGFIHILLFVFWLGADVGVFTSAVLAKNPKLSFETRANLLRLGLIIDCFPRACFALIFPVGLHLADGLGLYPVTGALYVFGWALAVFWLTIVFVAFANEGKPIAHRLNTIQFGLEAALGLLFTVVGLNSLATGAPISDTWFAVKILLFGLAFWAAMAIDLCFRPFFAPFMEIGQHGSTPEREEAVSRAINNTLVAVMTLYIIIAIIAFLGKVKPGF